MARVKDSPVRTNPRHRISRFSSLDAGHLRAGLLTQRIAPRLKLRARDDREPTEFEDCLFSPLPAAEPREARRDEGVRH